MSKNPRKKLRDKNSETIVQKKNTKFKYPEVRRDDVVDNYHGTKVSDPYRWLENSNSDETKNFIEAQNLLTDSYLNSTSSLKESIQNCLKELRENFTRYTIPARYGDKYYFDIDSILYVQDTLDSDEPRVLLDPKNLTSSNDGSIFPFSNFSHDGSIVAFAFFQNGSIGTDIHFLNTETGEKYSDVLEQVEFHNTVWTHDNLGVFYNHSLQQNSAESIEDDMKIYYHKIGTPQSEDIVVIEFPEEPSTEIYTDISDCGQWLFVSTINSARKNLLYFTELKENINGKFNLTQIVDAMASHFTYVGNDNTKAIFITDKNSPNKKIIAIDLLNYEEVNWTTLVSEEPDKILKKVTVVDNDKFVVQYLCGRDYILQLHSLKNGKLIKKLDLGIGSISGGIHGHRNYPEYIFCFTSFLIPRVIYKIDVNSFDKLEIHRESKLENYNPSLYKTLRVYYPNKDNKKIPMTIAMRKNAKLNSSMPALLSINRGYGILTTPHFSVENIIFIQHFNGIIAEPQIRGDSEYHEKWYNDGILEDKLNVIDDFQSAAEYLIKNGYTSREKLTIKGNFYGSCIIGTCLNERPDLFGAAVIFNGLFDILYFDKYTVCRNCEDRKTFENMLKYSSIHNVKLPINNEQYPAILLLSDIDNELIDSLHSFKFIATLQHEIGKLKQQKNPLMMKIDFNSYYDSPSADIEQLANFLTFLVKSLKLKIHFHNKIEEKKQKKPKKKRKKRVFF
ncbi:prolyl endopeptidase-like [Leptopilina heterotoma]|uniref:prolyl endopeptidase-like n=1 Tax=Leptopilina heterotoma TaxID=63436 RepID=UPI001CA7FBE9|nr:prolyl endopeptidase-like [Leptopilina heterotoma]